MDDIRQERPSEDSILKLNITKQEIWHTRQGIYCLSGLEK